MQNTYVMYNIFNYGLLLVITVIILYFIQSDFKFLTVTFCQISYYVVHTYRYNILYLYNNMYILSLR